MQEDNRRHTASSDFIALDQGDSFDCQLTSLSDALDKDRLLCLKKGNMRLE